MDYITDLEEHSLGLLQEQQYCSESTSRPSSLLPICTHAFSLVHEFALA